MNAPATLDDLHAARSKLLAKESALWEQRAKLEGLERTAEKAESDLKNVRGATSAELKNWTANACQGPMPGIDSMKLGRLQDAAMRARNAVELAGGACRLVARLQAGSGRAGG